MFQTPDCHGDRDKYNREAGEALDTAETVWRFALDILPAELHLSLPEKATESHEQVRTGKFQNDN